MFFPVTVNAELWEAGRGNPGAGQHGFQYTRCCILLHQRFADDADRMHAKMQTNTPLEATCMVLDYFELAWWPAKASIIIFSLI